MIDRRAKRQVAPGGAAGSGWEPGHAGVAEIANDSNDQANDSLDKYDYRASTDTTVQVTGRICGERIQGDKARFKRSYRVFTRSEKPKTGSSGSQADVSRLVITRRELCACLRSGEACVEAVDCPGVIHVPGDYIVDEPEIRIRPALLRRSSPDDSRLPAVKDLMKQVQFTMANSWRMPHRKEFGKVGFLDSEYLRDRLVKVLPQSRLDERVPVAEPTGDPTREKAMADVRVGDLLALDLTALMKETGLDTGQAAGLRRRLLGLG
jgi:hypothetical protein